MLKNYAIEVAVNYFQLVKVLVLVERRSHLITFCPVSQPSADHSITLLQHQHQHWQLWRNIEIINYYKLLCPICKYLISTFWPCQCQFNSVPREPTQVETREEQILFNLVCWCWLAVAGCVQLLYSWTDVSIIWPGVTSIMKGSRCPPPSLTTMGPTCDLI